MRVSVSASSRWRPGSSGRSSINRAKWTWARLAASSAAALEAICRVIWEIAFSARARSRRAEGSNS